MLFFILNDTNINFLKIKLWWKFYTIKKAFYIIKQVKLGGKKEFAAVTPDTRHEIFIINIIFFDKSNTNQTSNVYPCSRVQISILIANKAFILISTKYSDFADVFSSKLAFKLFKYININNHTNEFIDKQQELYKLIYSL